MIRTAALLCTALFLTMTTAAFITLLAGGLPPWTALGTAAALALFTTVIAVAAGYLAPTLINRLN